MRILEGTVLPGDHVKVEREGRSEHMKFERVAAAQAAAGAAR